MKVALFAAIFAVYIAISAALKCYDATSYDGILPSNATVMANCTSCATSRMEHILYTFITYQWSCQRGPANSPPVPESQCATMSMETADKAKTYAQAMCQCCEDLCNKNQCRAWTLSQAQTTSATLSRAFSRCNAVSPHTYISHQLVTMLAAAVGIITNWLG